MSLDRRKYSIPSGPRPLWPTTLGEARTLIERTFMLNRWDGRSRRLYLNSLGIRPVTTDKLDREACRLVLERMQRTRMIIFAEEPKVRAAGK